jgi:hypothetical protein
MELTVRTGSVVPAGIAAAFREEATTQAQLAIAIRMNVFLLIFSFFLGVVVISCVGTNNSSIHGLSGWCGQGQTIKNCSLFILICLSGICSAIILWGNILVYGIESG